MKYISIDGKSRDEVIKEAVKKFGKEVKVLRILKIEKPSEETEKKGLMGFFKKKEIKMIETYRGWFSIGKANPEEEEEERVEKQNEKTLPNHAHQQILIKKENLPNEVQVISGLDELKKMFGDILEKKIEQEEFLEGKNLENEFKSYFLKNDFSLEFAEKFISKLTVPIYNLESFKIILKEKMKLSLSLAKGFPSDSGRFFILFGPTGVGKTTTLAKLAAIYFRDFNKKLRFITLDNYRVGAAKQLEMYANAFNQPFHLIYNLDDLKAALKSVKPDEMVFVDTAGESLTKDMRLSEVEKMIYYFPEKTVKILTINANSKTSDLNKVREKFSRFQYDYYIITKLDETGTIGSVLDFLYKSEIPAAYFTTGQDAQDIETAEHGTLFKMLLD
ncbi:MAG TPA: hypothetical protein DHW82_11615 [Spirochaetia bacterium]|nr:hypothetical protein [Spirochaetia bacterium]